jgi:glutathione S-transferase
MALTFYYASGSPFAWRVWLALEHKQLAYDHRVMSFSAGDLKQPEFLAVNPRHKVPAIVDDGFALYESQAIVEYLEERYPAPPSLFPGDLRKRALVRRIVQEADQYLIVAFDPIIDQVFFTAPDKWDIAAIEDGRSKLIEELRRWEDIAADDFLAGKEPSAADFAAYPHLALGLRLDKKKPDLDVHGLIGPRVRAWMARVEALPFLRKTWPPHWNK